MATQKLMTVLKNCGELLEEPISTPLPERGIRQMRKNKRTSKEFKLVVQIGGYEMNQVILDLRSNVNIFPKKTWEKMGKP